MKVITTLPVIHITNKASSEFRSIRTSKQMTGSTCNTPPANKKIFKLVRLEIRDDKVVDASEKVLLKIEVDRENRIIPVADCVG